MLSGCYERCLVQPRGSRRYAGRTQTLYYCLPSVFVTSLISLTLIIPQLCVIVMSQPCYNVMQRIAIVLFSSVCWCVCSGVRKENWTIIIVKSLESAIFNVLITITNLLSLWTLEKCIDTIFFGLTIVMDLWLSVSYNRVPDYLSYVLLSLVLSFEVYSWAWQLCHQVKR